MSRSPHYARHKLASYLVALALALTFTIPAYAQETSVENEAALVPDQATVGATQDEASDLETAQRSGCQGVLTIDQPTGGDVRGQGLVSGWLADLAAPFNPGGPVDLYRGDTFVATAATGASRDVGNVRADVDEALGIRDGRTGWFIRMDWSSQPGGSQTYRVLGRTSCEWMEKSFTVNVNPTPPAPAASLTVSDESRTLSSNTGYNSGGVGTSCLQYNNVGQCTQVSSVNNNSSVCISRDALGNCIQYGGSGYGGYGYSGSNLSDVNFEFTVTLSPASTQTVTVNYATADGSAVANTDFASMSGTLSFAPGETTKTITVRVYNRGGTYSNDRDFFVRLSNPNGASISDGEGRGLIRRNLSSVSGCIQFDVNGNCISYSGTNSGYYGGVGTTCIQYNSLNQCIQYSNTGTSGFGGSFSVANLNGGSCAEGTNCTFRVTQTGGSGFVTVSWTATAPNSGTTTCTGTVDFSNATGASGTVSVGPNNVADIVLAVCSNDGSEPAETLTVIITPASGTTVTSSAIATIPAN